jgi:hypothetical protein
MDELLKQLQGVKVDEAMGENWPMVMSLDKDKVTQLANLKDIKNVVVVDNWEDDHQLCFSAKFEDQTGKPWQLSFWWVEPGLMSAAEYADDSKKAKSKFMKAIVEDAKDLLANSDEYFDKSGKNIS